jgi:hypothetical protein
VRKYRRYGKGDRTVTDIALVNQSTVVSDDEVFSWLPALQDYLNDDVRHFWGFDPVTLHLQPDDVTFPPGVWRVDLTDHSAIMGDLGAHDDDTGTPHAFVALADDIRYGSSITVTITHELAEMVVDPTTQREVTIDGVVYVVEVADPVEADSDGYPKQVNGVKIQCSNFVTPAYFNLPGGPQDGRFDMRGELTAPCPATLPGGYLLYFKDGQWHTDAARLSDGSLSHRATKIMGRTHRRAAKARP